jgi:hypothetical protein
LFCSSLITIQNTPLGWQWLGMSVKPPNKYLNILCLTGQVFPPWVYQVSKAALAQVRSVMSWARAPGSA